MHPTTHPRLYWLLIATSINYAAQIPYYLHLYYFPHHLLPSSSAIVLLGMTFVWFAAGYIGTVRRWRFGYPVLVSFLAVEALFYLHSTLSGALVFQLSHHDLLLRTIYLVGYISGAVAAYYLYILLRHRADFNAHK